MSNAGQPVIRASVVALAGGLDLVTPGLLMKSGRAIAGVNYEPCDSGYRRIEGFERIDGQPKPSEASYSYLTFSAGNAALLTGAVITGATSGATGKLVVNQVATSGSFGGGTAAGYLIITAITGTFVSGEALQVAGVTKATASAAPVLFGAPNDTDNSTYVRAAIEMARALIQPVPGSGAIRGVWMYKGVVYAFRDNLGATAGAMYKSTTAGWVLVSLGLTLPFTSGGVTEIAVGNTITGGTSGATAVITRVVLLSGTWAGGDAAGYFIMASKTGNFAAENLNVGASVNLATIAGNATATTLPVGGRYEFVNYNFYATTNRQCMYGCNGVGKAFEFDGTILSPISTGQGTDTPIHITAHRNRLFLAFRGGVFDCSIAGQPQNWSGVLGATEFGMGYEITGMMGEILDTLFVFSTDQVKVLYGSAPTGSDPFTLKALSPEAGGEEWSIQNIGLITYSDQQGVRTQNSTQAFGNFSAGTLTQSILPLLQLKRGLGTTVVASLRCREKTQYRLFFSDGTGITIYIGKTKASYGQAVPTPEIMPFDLGKVIRCACSVLNTSNQEIMLFGSDDGYIYQLDAGTSMDGSSLISYLRLAFDASGSPSYMKRYKKLVVEVDKIASRTDTNPAASLSLSAEFSYADTDQPAVLPQGFSITGGGGFWDEMLWDNFFWDSAVYGRAEAYIDGIGRNISVAIRCEATYEQPHTLHGYELQYVGRRLSR